MPLMVPLSSEVGEGSSKGMELPFICKSRLTVVPFGSQFEPVNVIKSPLVALVGLSVSVGELAEGWPGAASAL